MEIFIKATIKFDKEEEHFLKKTVYSNLQKGRTFVNNLATYFLHQNSYKNVLGQYSITSRSGSIVIEQVIKDLNPFLLFLVEHWKKEPLNNLALSSLDFQKNRRRQKGPPNHK